MSSPNQARPRLLVFDGMNLVRRIYEANREPDSADKLSRVLQHALSSMRRAFDEIQPSHAAAAFDVGGSTWRHAIHPAYKAHRSPTPAALRTELPVLFDRIRHELGTQVIAVPGIEAEDVMATLAMKWQERGEAVDPAVLVTTDKDMLVLVHAGCRIRDHFEQAWRDAGYIQKRFGVRPEQMADYLALCGDDGDGIPGAEGIGAKGAARLLNVYESLDRIMREAASLRDPTARRLRAGADRIALSRQLAAFRTDLSFGLTWSMLRLNGEPASPAVETLADRPGDPGSGAAAA